MVRQKNGSTETASSAHGRRHMTSAAELVLGTERFWDLDIWELQGASDTWGEQLAAHYRSQPVFALISGLSNSTWQPVHDFCDHEHIPCWFPTVDLPVKTQSTYDFYFSGGVLLEANVIAHQLTVDNKSPKRVVQIFRDDVVGRSASQELTHALESTVIKVESRALVEGGSPVDSLRVALTKLNAGDAVMFWLRENDIKALDKIKPVTGVNYFFSEKLANTEQVPLTDKWKKSSHLVYLYQLPEKRLANLSYLHSWLNSRKLPMVDEALQSEVFFAFNYLTDTTSEMLNNLYRDYLVERAETMINKREGSKAEQETRDRLVLGKSGELIKRHGKLTADENVRIQIPDKFNASDASHGTTLYPNLSLGPNQRFASKGGYVLGFAGKHGEKLIDESGWIVP
jgi:hypothetical protein